jgi:hypothetical protein
VVVDLVVMAVDHKVQVAALVDTFIEQMLISLQEL